MDGQSSKTKSLSRVVTAIAAAAFLLHGCGGGSDGAAGPAGAAGGTGATGAAGAPGKDLTTLVNAAKMTAAEWAAFAPKAEVTSVTIPADGKPVVSLKVTDATGHPMVGLGGQRKASTAYVPTNYNLSFTLAKLVPGSNGEPSKWVTYLVNSPVTTVPAAGAADRVANFPQSDSQGTMVDNGDGTYKYTFWHDITASKAWVDALTETALTKKTSYGDTTYEPSRTHRLGVMITGNQPGTGTNTPDAVQVVPAVAMVKAFNTGYDFVPAGGTPTVTRNVVTKASCTECHDGKGLAHGTRNDPALCVTCHTDQIRATFDQEAPRTGFALNVTTGSNAVVRPAQAVINGRAVGNFPNMVHKIHMTSLTGSKLVITGYNFNNDAAGQFNAKMFPQDSGNCTKCHDGSATAKNKTSEGDNWKNVPSQLACGSCHDGIDFATGTGTTIAGLTTGHAAGTIGALADNSKCAICHDAAAIPVQHNDHKKTTADATKRTMSATISSVAVGATDGTVKVTFSVKDAGVAVTDKTKFVLSEMTLAQLQPAVNGTSTHWVSYTSRFRTKDATMQPILQGYSEAGSAGTLVANVDGTFSYTFALLNADTAGDIRTVTHAHNATSASVGAYVGTAWTGPANSAGVLPAAGTGWNVVTYNPALTHRVGMIFQKVGTPNVDNNTNATFDFVPAGTAATSTRNIVTMDNCATCHGGIKLHKAYAIEMCVTCHNSSTFDPLTAGNPNVDLQTVVHKLHKGGYTINGETFAGGYPGILNDCAVCHKETATKPGTTTKLENAANWRTTPTALACGTCHDSTAATAHISTNVSAGVEQCVVCHGSGKVADVQVVHQ